MPIIPQNIKYEERLLGPFTLKQSIYIIIGAGIIIQLFVGEPDMDPTLKYAIMTVTIMATIGFAMFNLDVWIVRYLGFLKSTKKSSWISPAARELMGVKSIRADAVFLQNSRVLGLLKVKPIHFGVLSPQDQETVIYGFLEFLNALNFPIQIIMRSVNLEMEDYLRHLKRRILKRDDKEALAYYEHFAEYLRNYIKVNEINDRLFYILVTAEKKPDEKQTIESLETRLETIINTLAVSGLQSERMNTHQLINFYTSYFTETFEIYDSMIAPLTMYRKMWAEESSEEKEQKKQMYKGRTVLSQMEVTS